ncbi:MAG: SusC/RagA family TonB-linked outer membrane protein [Saprospirales bacterium]|nr:SusC/RagA family TonB-linked outer membrane protein [Saprospirales bacterium]MBK8920677.1 SusC/RagA family TonB-linked outer membrane protein [Saprospirales bacterium]
MKQLPTLSGRLAAWLLVLLPTLLSAQSVNYSVKGTVTDDSGAPLASVSVVLVEARQATFTDERGFYDLSGAVAEGVYTLEFRYFGFQTERRSLTIALGKANFTEDAILGSDILNLDEVVITGNSPTSTRRQLGNSIGVVDGRSLEKSGSANPLGALAGKVAGAQISQNQGDPSGGFSIQLRGANSIKGSSDPLYIVDGVIVDNSSQNVINLSGDAMTTSFQAGQNRLVDINPNDIERVEVLNGASAAALYGSRASNGVVQIFTKRGRTSKPTIEFSTSAGISQLRKKIFFTTYGKRFGVKGNDRLETAQDRLTILLHLGPNEATLQSQGVNYTKVGSVNRLLITDQYDVTRYDYQDEVFQTAFGTESFLSVTGGSEKSNYYASLGYTNNDGIVKNTNFTKYTGRLRFNQTLSRWATLTAGLSYTNSRSRDMPNGNNFFSPVSTIFIIDNVWDITERNADGTLKQVELVRLNPLTVVETFDITQRTNRNIADIGLKLFPFKGFRVDYTFGIDNYSLQGNEYHPRVPYAGVAATFFPDGYVAVANSDVTQYNSDLLATYETTLGAKLTSTTTAGYQYQYLRSDFAAQEGRDLTPLIRNISAASNLFTLPVQSISQLSVNGYFLQETFGWDEMLYLTLAGRVDGSSAFSEDNQSNFYPKASLAWVASRLFQSTAVSTLKLRASYGQAGNLTGLGAYDRFNNFAGTLLTGLPAVTPPRALNNPDVKPEVMTETEAGADLAFLRNRIGLSVTYYNQDVDNLLFNRPLPPSIGGTSIVTNVGKMNNKGIEVLVQAQAVRGSNFSWDIGLNFSSNRNEVSGLDGVLSLRGSDGAQSALNGEPFGVFFGRYYARTDDGSLLLTSQGLAQPERGLVILESKYDEATLPTGAIKERIYRYAGSVYVPVRDANGQPLTTGTQELRKVLGNPYPDWIGSFTSALTWKRLTFNFQFDAFMGAEIYNWNRITGNNVGFGETAEKELKGELPRGYVGSIAGGVTGSRIQEEHIEDASYIKLRELGLTYSFGRVGRAFENLSVSFLGRNLFSFDDYLGFDPETNSAGQNDRVRGDDFGNVPIPRTLMLRLNARF